MVHRRLGALFGTVALALTVVSCAQTDAGITTAVKAKLVGDSSVKASEVSVDTKEGVVTLSGNVDSQIARAQAVQLTKETKGVRQVVDRMTVTEMVPTTGVADEPQQKATDTQKKAGDAAEKTGDAITDAALTTKVKTKFLADTDISGLKIDVDTKDHVVTLTGTVPSAAEKRRAVAVAKETDGVKSVVDHLKVGKAAK
jgi:hyperosmotically inducible protein